MKYINVSCGFPCGPLARLCCEHDLMPRRSGKGKTGIAGGIPVFPSAVEGTRRHLTSSPFGPAFESTYFFWGSPGVMQGLPACVGLGFLVPHMFQHRG